MNQGLKTPKIFSLKQARKLQATLEGCNPKLWLNHSLTGVKCRATGVAKKKTTRQGISTPMKFSNHFQRNSSKIHVQAIQGLKNSHERKLFRNQFENIQTGFEQRGILNDMVLLWRTVGYRMMNGGFWWTIDSWDIVLLQIYLLPKRIFSQSRSGLAHCCTLYICVIRAQKSKWQL